MAGLETIFNAVSLIDTAHQVSAVQDNDRQRRVDLELVIDTPPQAFGPAHNIKLHILPSIDGTNYEDGAPTVDPMGGGEVYTFKTRDNEETAHRLVALNIKIPAMKFKYALVANFNYTVTVTLRQLKRDKSWKDV